MEDVTYFFQEIEDSFTVYVVEQAFVNGRGREYFNSFAGKENYISSNLAIQNRIYKILSYIERKVPQVAELVEMLFLRKGNIGITEVITALAKLFSLHEHQAAGPEIIDPILIQEGQILQKFLSQLIALHRRSILQPRIIIMLKDNNFERARELLKGCPNGINVKMIRNTGETQFYKVINKGTEDINEFLDAYARQCFSTCSETPRCILFNDQWADNSLIKQYSPIMFKIRSKLIYDDKEDVRDDLNMIITDMDKREAGGADKTLLNSFLCMARLSRVFCYDKAGTDLNIAQTIADELDNRLLKAHCYRFSHFLPISRKEKQNMLMEAHKIFSDYNIEDHAIYCLNNSLIHQFSMDKINIREFRKMKETALTNVPGLVGMSHILNNVGVAHFLSGGSEEAVECLTQGLDYAKDRPIQKMALLSNRLMAKSYSLAKIDEAEIQQVVTQLFDSLGRTSLPFNVSHFAMNILSVAFRQSPAFGQYLISEFPIKELVQRGFDTNNMGSGSIVAQMAAMSEKYHGFTMLDDLRLPQNPTEITGVRYDFIKRHGFNPFFHNVWL